MASGHEFKTRLKSRLATLVDVNSLRRVDDPIEKRRTFGQAILLLGILVAIIGLYISPDDMAGRGVFLFGALLYSGFGAWSIDRANLLERGGNATKSAKP